MTATHENVVPRSIPTTAPLTPSDLKLNYFFITNFVIYIYVDNFFITFQNSIKLDDNNNNNLNLILTCICTGWSRISHVGSPNPQLTKIKNILINKDKINPKFENIFRTF